MNPVIGKIRKELIALSNPKTKESTQRFFKKKILQYGIKSADTRKISKAYFNEVKAIPKERIFILIEELFKSGYLEESIIASIWTESLTKKYVQKDIVTFEDWINSYISNWATCDTFCNHAVGNLIMMYPEHISYLKRWAKSNNMWLRRAAAVSLIVPAKKGHFINDIFEIANILLTDEEDLVQKGYGWMLKVAANNHEKAVFDFVILNKAIMPRTALRYAIEKMPLERRRLAMSK